MFKVLDLRYAGIDDVSGPIQIIGKRLKKLTAYCILSMSELTL